MNVILISLDTTRADHLGCYGWHRATSPHLDRLAARGTLFERCFSPWIPTHAAHTTMLTGRDVMAHQVVAQGGKAELSADIPTLAEILRDRGYFTGAADNLKRWFSRGFEVYEGYQWSHDMTGAWRKGEAVLETALRVFNQAAAHDQPFFLFIHFWDPHTPYLPPPPFDRMFYTGDERDPRHHSIEPVLNFPPFQWYFRRWMGEARDIEFPKAQYDAEIAYMDCCLQHLFQRLEELQLTQQTLLVITADHGEELDEHGMWFDHHGLYDTNLHVPLILHMPGTVPAGRRVRGMVRLLDIVPTVLDAARVGEDETPLLDGSSLMPLLGGNPAAGTCETLYATECTWMRKRALRNDAWKLIVALEPDLHGRPPIELYDLCADPGEQVNLANRRPEVVRALREELEGWVARRMRETGLPDPLAEQEITLRQIGQPPEGEG